MDILIGPRQIPTDIWISMIIKPIWNDIWKEEGRRSKSKNQNGHGKSSYAAKRRAKYLGVCHKCARTNCDGQRRLVGINEYAKCRGSQSLMSKNQEIKIDYIKNGLSRINRSSPVLEMVNDWASKFDI